MQQLARSVDATRVGGSGNEYAVFAGPGLDHRDDVERLLGRQGVAYVPKWLNTDEALGAEFACLQTYSRIVIKRRIGFSCPRGAKACFCAFL